MRIATFSRPFQSFFNAAAPLNRALQLDTRRLASNEKKKKVKRPSVRAEIARLDYERWPTPSIRSKVDSIRHFYFPKVESKKAAKVKEEGFTIEQAIQMVVEKASSALPSQEIKLLAKCDLCAENANGVRGVFTLKKSMASNPSILVLAPPEHWDRAKAAGATMVGSSELVSDILEGKIPFDRCIATVDQMPVLAKLARFLGPKGLMPNAKTGTLTNDLEGAIKNALYNSPFRIEKDGGTLDFAFARPSFTRGDIEANLKIVMDYLQSQNKTTNTGRFVESASLQMGPLTVRLAEDQYGPTKGPKFLMAIEKLRAQIAIRNAKRMQAVEEALKKKAALHTAGKN